MLENFIMTCHGVYPSTLLAIILGLCSFSVMFWSCFVQYSAELYRSLESESTRSGCCHSAFDCSLRESTWSE